MGWAWQSFKATGARAIHSTVFQNLFSWRHILDLLGLVKKNLCPILLLKADYDWLSKFLVSKHLIPWADAMDLIPEEDLGS